MKHSTTSTLPFFAALVGGFITWSPTFAQKVGNDQNRISHKLVRMTTADRYSPPELSCLTFSTGNSLLAVALKNEHIVFIRVDSSDVLGRVAAHAGDIISMSFSKNDQRLLVIGTTGRTLFNVALGTEIRHRLNRIVGEPGLECERRNGKWLISAIVPGGPVAEDGRIHMGDELTGVGIGKSGLIRSVTQTTQRELKKLLSGPADTYLRLEFIRNGFQDRQTAVIRLRAASTPAADRFRRNAKTLFDENKAWCISDGYHTFCNATTGQEVRAFRTQDITNRIGVPTLSPSAGLFAFLGRKLDGTGRAVEIFDIEHGKRIQFIDNITADTPRGKILPPRVVYDMTFSPDNRHLIVSCWDRIRVFDIENGRLQKSFNLRPDLNGKERIRTSGETENGSASLMEQAVAKEIGRLDLRTPHRFGLVDSIAVGESNILAVGQSPCKVELWDFATGDRLYQFANLPDERLEALVFSGDGRWLAFFVHGELHLCDVSSLSGN